MIILREFLYRQDDLVAQFLEQLEGGEFDEQHIREQATRATGVGATASVGPLAASGDHRREGTSETELTMRQTAGSRFNRLHALLDASGSIQPLEALDDDIWDQIGRNEVVEVEAVLNLLPGVLEMSQATSLSGLLPVINMMKDLPDEFRPDDFNPEDAEQMSAQISTIDSFAQHLGSGPIPCTFVPAGSSRYTFFAELARASVEGEVADLEGEVTVLARLKRKIAKGKPETLGGLPGIQLNREQRRTGGAAPLTTQLRYPAAVATVIGIYR
ncbi:MAG: hypothetical protein JNK12_12495 [Acidimicrobiales bacterium]|nr:hypothetical protein [Acidimicrobiales bacterium]